MERTNERNRMEIASKGNDEGLDLGDCLHDEILEMVLKNKTIILALVKLSLCEDA